MAILKYRDPATGEFKRLAGGSGAKEVEISAIEGTLTLDDDTLALLADNATYIRYNGEIYRLFSVATPIKIYISITDDLRKQITVDFTAKTCVYAESSVKIPEIVGADGITIDKAADSEKIEISGKNFVHIDNTPYIVYSTTGDGTQIARSLGSYPLANRVVQYNNTGIIKSNTPIADLDATNKKYVDDNFVDKLHFTNLEQALKGYILDTTEESYTDLDSAVLKDSVTVDSNVYPIADKTRALVSKIEGKTTKMVQLLDKSKFPATSTPIAGVTVTKTDDGGLHVLGSSASDGERNSWGITVNIEKDHKYLSLLKGNNKITTPFVTLKSDTSQYVGFVADIVTSTIEGECNYGFNLATGDYDETIYLQLFDLTAMNRKDITTVEQFKAEFPEFYPYENGNIYPAKISGVKFFENQDKNGEQGSVTFPETYDLHGIGDYKDYLEITKNENNDYYTLKKVQCVDKYTFTGAESFSKSNYKTDNHISYYSMNVLLKMGIGFCNKYTTKSNISVDIEGILFGAYNAYPYFFVSESDYADVASFKAHLTEQFTNGDPVIIYYVLQKPVETVISTNLTYEQVTAIRTNGGLIEAVGNANKSYVKPTVNNTVVYRLTAKTEV